MTKTSRPYKKPVIEAVFRICLSVAVVLWSLMPAMSHSPTLIATVQDHLQMIEDHGHAHDDGEDLIWALHGHSHDISDHDHSMAILPRLDEDVIAAPLGPPPRITEKARHPAPVLGHEKPPRM